MSSAPDVSQPPQGGSSFCDNCGTELSQDSRFCERCGSRVDDAPAVNFSTPPTRAHSPELAAETKALLADAQREQVPASKAHHGRVAQGLSATGLALLVLSLLLPWMQVSCGGMRVDIEGHRLLLGTVHEKFESLGPSRANASNASNKESPNLYLVLWVAVVALGGLIGAGSEGSQGKIATLAGAGIGAVFLLIFYNSTNQDVQKQMVQGMGMIAVQWSSGFWLAAAATGAIGVAGVIGLMDSS